MNNKKSFKCPECSFEFSIDHLLALGDMLFDGVLRKGNTLMRMASNIKDSLPKIVAYADDPEANEAAIDTLTELLKNQAKELSEFFDATPVVVPEQRDPMVDALFGRHREA